jgi:hypothetical protein
MFENSDAFAERYCSLLFLRSQETVDAVDAAALSFWLKLEETDTAWPLLGNLSERALDTIAARIAALPKKKRAIVITALGELDEFKGAATQQLLNAFLERLTRQKPSWVSRLFGASRD